jgi:UDP-4-amino-4,6-dideoxy-N-acetyl-beta-L-altrosamine N-acetyltransferase
MIVGKICNLRKLKLSDARDILKWRRSRNVQKFFPTNIENNFNKHQKWVKRIIKSRIDKYFIIEKKNKTKVGVCYLINIDFFHRKAEFGYYLSNKNYYGKGYGLESQYLTINFAFDKLFLNKIICENLENNQKRLNIHKKFGFKLDGVKREEIFKNNKYLDIYLMSLLKKDYNKYKKKILRIFNLLYG